MDDQISRQAALDAMGERPLTWTGGDYELGCRNQYDADRLAIETVPSAQQEDYTDMKTEFLRMASYIDVLLECSDEQKETLMGFISRLAEYMPWTERD